MGRKGRELFASSEEAEDAIDEIQEELSAWIEENTKLRRCMEIMRDPFQEQSRFEMYNKWFDENGKVKGILPDD